MSEHWKFFIRSVVSCHQDDVLERFIADHTVHEEIKKFEATVRSHWKRVMGPVPKAYVMPELKPSNPPSVNAARQANPEN